LASGKNSRLYKRLVYDLQVAQDVNASQNSATLGSTFLIVVTARAGHTLPEMLKLVDEEIAKIAAEPPTPPEVDRFKNQLEASFYSAIETVGGFGGKADQLNAYFTLTGNPGYFEQDLARFRALSPRDVRAAAFTYLGPGRVVLSVVPQGKKDLA